MVVFFSFLLFLFYLRASDGQTWKQLLICIELGDQGWVEDTRLPSWPRQEVSCKKQPLFNPGWLFFFFPLLSIIRLGRKQKSNFKQSTDLGREGKRRQSKASGWPYHSCLCFFPSLLRMLRHQTESSSRSSASPEEATTMNSGRRSTRASLPHGGELALRGSLSPATWAQPSVRVFSPSTWEKPLFQGTFLHEPVRRFSRTNQPCGKWWRHFQANWFFLTGLQMQRPHFFSWFDSFSQICGLQLCSRLCVRCAQRHKAVASLCSGHEKDSRHISKETQFLWVAPDHNSCHPSLSDKTTNSALTEETKVPDGVFICQLVTRNQK